MKSGLAVGLSAALWPRSLLPPITPAGEGEGDGNGDSEAPLSVPGSRSAGMVPLLAAVAPRRVITQATPWHET